MALLFIDSFDHYQDDQIIDKYTSTGLRPTILAGGGRCGTACAHFDFSATINRAINTSSTRITVGFAIKVREDLTFLSIPMYRPGPTDSFHFSLQWNFDDASLSVYRNDLADTVLGTSAAGILSQGQWYFLECQSLIHQTAGEIIVHLNGIEVLNISGVMTTGESFNGPYPEEIRYISLWGYSNRQWYCDDVYVLDDTGPAPCNDFLGDCRVEYLRPNAAGTYQQWTPTGAATNWQAVDDNATPDDDGSYVESVTPGQIDTNNYEPTGLPSGPIFGAQLGLHAMKSEIGPRIIAPVANAIVGTPHVGISAESYQYWLTMYQNNPVTGLPWTIAEINAAQFGVKVIT